MEKVTLKQIVVDFERAGYWCDKACGCGHCAIDYLDSFVFSDDGASLKDER